MVGLVGAGKSSLIQAIIGEMEKLNGDVTINVSKIALLFSFFSVQNYARIM